MPTDIIEAKKKLRRQILSERRQLDTAVCREDGRQLMMQLCQLEAYKKAETILCYASCKGEADTWQLIERAFSEGKKVALPRVTGPAEMHFYRITSVDDVEPGYYAIPEPTGMCQEEVTEGLMIVPGTAFDRKMHRMGYGGGFYDAWLMTYGHQVTACGWAYDFQLLDAIPVESHDRRMHLIVTPTEVIWEGDVKDDSD